MLWFIRKIVKKGDYLYGVCPEHPLASRHGYVLLHRLFVENYLGYMIPPSWSVHHINEDKYDNRIENLDVATVRAHSSYHASTGLAMVKLQCPCCGVFFTRRYNNTSLCQNSVKTNNYCSHVCSGKGSNIIRQNQKLPFSNNFSEFFYQYSTPVVQLDSEHTASTRNVQDRSLAGVLVDPEYEYLIDQILFPTHPGIIKTCPQCQKSFRTFNNRQRSCSNECNNLIRRKVNRPNQEELKELLQNNSYCAVGRMFGVSNTAIRKWEKQYDRT